MDILELDERELLKQMEELGQEELGQEESNQEETKPEGFEAIEDLIDERITKAIKDMGFEKFSPIQLQAIPFLLNGEDIIGQAQTGTGKTAAFGIPLIQKVDPEKRKLQAIILCPTRELAMQAAAELRNLAKYMQSIKILPIYGGQEIGKQITALKGTQVIVGTPGRVMDHMRRHTIKLEDVNTVVLDEADEMLNMGFREDMELILGQIPGDHQTALFSATMPQPILDITHQFQKNARIVKVAAKELTIPLVSQKYYLVKNQDKDAACTRLLEYYQPKLCLIFCNTKRKVDELAEILKQHGYQAEGLHGDMSQHQRDVAMNRFRNGSTNILIATDVAARGIDVDNVEAVINYDVPQDIEYYVHRIGRTGRAGKTGRSFTFISGREIFKIREIERLCKTTVEEKKLPGANKVMRAKADKYLSQAWEMHEHDDIEVMKSFLSRKMEEEGCDALELAAAMLKLQVGDKGEEIAVDEYKKRSYDNGKSRGSYRDRDGNRGRSNFRGRDDSRSSYRDRDNSKSRSSFVKKDDYKGKSSYAGKDDYKGKSSFAGKDDFKSKNNYKDRDESKSRSSYAKKDDYKGKSSTTGSDDFKSKSSYKEKDESKSRSSYVKKDDYKSRPSVKAKESKPIGIAFALPKKKVK